MVKKCQKYVKNCQRWWQYIKSWGKFMKLRVLQSGSPVGFMAHTMNDASLNQTPNQNRPTCAITFKPGSKQCFPQISRCETWLIWLGGWTKICHDWFLGLKSLLTSTKELVVGHMLTQHAGSWFGYVAQHQFALGRTLAAKLGGTGSLKSGCEVSLGSHFWVTLQMTRCDASCDKLHDPMFFR